ncbi:MAG: hypothetical protein IPN89_10875 [Saprospiraceae bacterium]|nr:hypothetical protein [Saprospiraceae bacterium]
MSNFALPVVATVPGFSVEYSINSGPFTANPMTSMTPGCYTIIARYVLASMRQYYSRDSWFGDCGKIPIQ